LEAAAVLSEAGVPPGVDYAPRCGEVRFHWRYQHRLSNWICCRSDGQALLRRIGR